MDSIKEHSIRIRPATEADVAFIFSTWLRSFRDSPFAAGISTTIYYAEHHKVVERLLKNCQTYVACSNNDISELYGFICGQEVDGILVVHYVYVKHSFRHLGIGKQLLNIFGHNPDRASIYTHMTKASRSLAQKFCFIHSPYVALTGDYQVGKTRKLTKKVQEEIYGDDAKDRVDEFAHEGNKNE